MEYTAIALETLKDMLSIEANKTIELDSSRIMPNSYFSGKEINDAYFAGKDEGKKEFAKLILDTIVVLEQASKIFNENKDNL